MTDVWSRMHGRPRRKATTVQRHTLPKEPGAYAWYRGTDTIYVGGTEDLRETVWGKHLSHSPTLSGSDFRKIIAEHLGIAGVREIESGSRLLDDDELARIRDFVEGCQLAWLVAESPDEAAALESILMSDWTSPL